MRSHWTEIEKYLEDQKVAQELIGELRDFHMRYEVEDQVKERVEKPDILFYGKKILEMSIAALLQGDNLLLSGAKATGKNVLCETLAWIFGRPEYDISFHVNTDSADLIGTDTFINNEVRLRKGPIYQCAEFGGFGILDEINMAKNDAVSVLHATLDHRRRIDIPGYNRILLHPATRFIGTHNFVRHRFSVHFDLFYRIGMQIKMQFLADGFARSRRREILIPPPVLPAQAPQKVSSTRIVLDTAGHWLKSVVA